MLFFKLNHDSLENFENFQLHWTNCKFYLFILLLVSQNLITSSKISLKMVQGWGSGFLNPVRTLHTPALHLKYLANSCYSVTVYWLNNRWLKYWGSVTSISNFASDIIRQFQMIRMIMKEQLVSPSSECLCICWQKKK